MGSRNLDRITLVERRHEGQTVADMWRNGWRCHAVCETCGVELRVALEVLIRAHGPALSLWNRTTACRRVIGSGGCPGRMFFKARPQGAQGFEFMGRNPRPRRPEQGPYSGGRGQFLGPEDVEPAAFTAARGPAPPD